MSDRTRNLLAAVLSAAVVLGVAAYVVAQRDEPVVRLTEVECQAAQRAADAGQDVLLGLERDCARSGYPVRR